jgi:predicted RNA polymerase sigma factor
MNPELESRRLIDDVARRSYGKLVAILAAPTHDIAAAEDALSEAFTSALTDWPANGCPANPEAWLLTVGRRRMIDVARRRFTADRATETLQILATAAAASESDAENPDRRLALMFVCAHPAIDRLIRAPLMLQVVLGLEAKTIASAFLMSPSAMGKRLVRAKAKIRRTGIPFRIPEREELATRLDTVLDAVYAAYSEGWSDPSGTDAAQRALTDEAIYLSRLLTELLPTEAEALGLLALILHADARRRARRNQIGEYVPLANQDQSLWNWQMIEEAERLIRNASSMGSIGRYQLQAAIQSAHVYRCRTGENNWASVVQLYDALLAIDESPVVAINRALAFAEIESAAAGLNELKKLNGDTRLDQYQPYWAARAELMARVGAADEARAAYEIAIGLERDPAVRRFLILRQTALMSEK